MEASRQTHRLTLALEGFIFFHPRPSPRHSKIPNRGKFFLFFSLSRRSSSRSGQIQPLNEEVVCQQADADGSSSGTTLCLSVSTQGNIFSFRKSIRCTMAYKSNKLLLLKQGHPEDIRAGTVAVVANCQGHIWSVAMCPWDQWKVMSFTVYKDSFCPLEDCFWFQRKPRQPR